MERFMALVKKYPLWIAGAVLGVIALIWLSSRDTSSGPQVSAITSFGPSDASVNANAQVQIAQMGFVAQGAANAAALEGMAIEADVAKFKYGLDATSYEQMLNTTRAMSEKDADTAVALASKNADTALAIASGQYQSNKDIATIVTNAQTQQSQIGANAATSLAQIQAQSELDKTNANNWLQQTLAAMGFANQQTMAQLGFANDQAMADKQAQLERERNAAAAQAAEQQRAAALDAFNMNKAYGFMNAISGGIANMPMINYNIGG